MLRTELCEPVQGQRRDEQQLTQVVEHWKEYRRYHELQPEQGVVVHDHHDLRAQGEV